MPRQANLVVATYVPLNAPTGLRTGAMVCSRGWEVWNDRTCRKAADRVANALAGASSVEAMLAMSSRILEVARGGKCFCRQ